MKISVIIPTYTRPQSLLQTLCSLQEQTLANFEIIVVDNAADSDVERMATEFNHAATVPVRYMPEPQLGAHNARHTGAHAAEGDILVFADDDETFAPEWLGAYARAFAEHPEMAAAGGPIRLVWEAPPPAWLLEFMGHARTFIILGLLDASDEFCLSPKGGFFSGNMAIRRDVFFQLGGFNPDQVGAFLLGDGETGLNRKLWDQGMLVGYVPEAIIYHHIPPQKMTVKFFRRRMANEGAAEVYTRFHEGVPGWFHLCKHAAGITLRNGKPWIADLFLKGRTDVRSLTTQLHAARTQSELKYVIRLMLDKNLRKLVLKKDWLNESCASASYQT